MAADDAGSRHGAYLRLAEALVRGDDKRALETTRDILTWEDDLEPGWLDVPGVTAALRAGHILAEGVLRTADDTDERARSPATTSGAVPYGPGVLLVLHGAGARPRALTPCPDPAQPNLSGPTRSMAIWMSTRFWSTMAWRYSSQSGCSPLMRR